MYWFSKGWSPWFFHTPSHACLVFVCWLNNKFNEFLSFNKFKIVGFNSLIYSCNFSVFSSKSSSFNLDFSSLVSHIPILLEPSIWDPYSLSITRSCLYVIHQMHVTVDYMWAKQVDPRNHLILNVNFYNAIKQLTDFLSSLE